MKRNNSFGVWHRCALCGTIFSDKIELREHLAQHRPAGRTGPKPTPEEPEPETHVQFAQTGINLSHQKYLGWKQK